MWVNSKTAAAVLSIKFDTLRKKVLRASNDCKNFCVVEYQKLYFQKIAGRGGASGKVLQIWLDDEIIAEFESKNGVRVSQNQRSGGERSETGFYENKRSGDTHEVRGGFLAEQSEAEQNKRSGGERSETGFCENKRSGATKSQVSCVAKRSRANVHEKKFLDTSAISEAECSNLLSSKKSTASQT